MAALRNTTIRSGSETFGGSTTLQQAASSLRTSNQLSSRTQASVHGTETIRSSTVQAQSIYTSGEGGGAAGTAAALTSEASSSSDSETFSFVPWMKFQVVAIPQPDVMAQSLFLKGIVEEVKRKTTEEVIKEVQEQLEKEVQRMVETLKSTVTSKLDAIDTIFTEQFKESIKLIKTTQTVPQTLSLLPNGSLSMAEAAYDIA